MRFEHAVDGGHYSGTKQDAVSDDCTPAIEDRTGMNQCRPPFRSKFPLQLRSDSAPHARRSNAKRESVVATTVLPQPIDVTDDQIPAVEIRSLREIAYDEASEIERWLGGVDLFNNPFDFAGLPTGPDNDDSFSSHLAAAP
jgi:hypothetical protein